MNRLLRRSMAAALGVHIGLLAAGGALAPRFASPTDDPLRTIDVGLESPEPPPPIAPPAPVPVLQRALRFLQPEPTPEVPPAPPQAGAPVRVAQSTPAVPVRPTGATTRPQPDPGGALNVGTASAHGDLPGLPTGQTPVGWVPGPATGRGAGSGTGEGVGRSEPTPQPPAAPPAPAPAAPPAVTPAAPAKPEPPPPPKRVSVRICTASRLRPNPHCPDTASAEFVEGSEPHETCAQHKAPPPPPAPAPVPPPKEERREEPRLTPARIARSTKPDYPASALDSDHQGSVLLKVEVRSDGTAGEISVARSSGSRVLDEAAAKAVKRWKWDPAHRGDEAVASTVHCRVRFELEE